MTEMTLVATALSDGLRVRERTLATLVPVIEQTAQVIADALQKGNKVLVFGNGGSAAEAQHLAGELTGRYRGERAALPCICLSSDSSVVTCVGNDYGYDQVFARQIYAFAQPGDVAIGMTTSGKSANVVQGLRAARERGAVTVALVGARAVQAEVDYALEIQSESTARIQEEHLAIIHCWCDAIDIAFHAQ